jgi:hypothetical protein
MSRPPINGDNPAIIQVGATYTDLGAQITSPQQDLNLASTAPQCPPSKSTPLPQ